MIILAVGLRAIAAPCEDFARSVMRSRGMAAAWSVDNRQSGRAQAYFDELFECALVAAARRRIVRNTKGRGAFSEHQKFFRSPVNRKKGTGATGQLSSVITSVLADAGQADHR